MAAIQVPAWLKKKVGPFPVGVWLLIGGAGIAIAVVVRRRTSTAELAEPELFEEDLAGAAASQPFGVPIGGGAGGDFFDFPTSLPPETPPPVIPPPLPEEPPPPEPPPPPPPSPTVGCTKPTKPAILGGYKSAPNRFCPVGWHMAVQGPCAGMCIPNVG